MLISSPTFQQMATQGLKPSNIDVEDLRRKNEHLLQLQREYQSENQQLEQGLREIHNSLKNVKASGQKGDLVIQCPTLDKLLHVSAGY